MHHLKKLKIFLIVLTLIEIGFILLLFFNTDELISYIFKNNLDQVFGLFHWLSVAIFIWFIWVKMPKDKKSNINNTLMIVFLGIIGLWLWFPNKKEIEDYRHTYNL